MALGFKAKVVKTVAIRARMDVEIAGIQKNDWVLKYEFVTGKRKGSKYAYLRR